MWSSEDNLRELVWILGIEPSLSGLTANTTEQPPWPEKTASWAMARALGENVDPDRVAVWLAAD